MTTKEIKDLFPIEIQIDGFHKQVAHLCGGQHKLGVVLLTNALPKELHEHIFWGLSIGSVQGVLIKTVHKELYKGKWEEVPLYLDQNLKETKIKFELR